MERKCSDDATSSSGTPGNTIPKLAVSIPHSTPLLDSSPVGIINTATSPTVTASSTRRRYSWNIKGPTSPRANSHRVSISRLPDKRLPPLADENGFLQNDGTNKIDHLEAGLFADVVLSPVTAANFPDFGLASSPSQLNGSSGESSSRHGVSPKQYSSPEPETYELDILTQAEGSNSSHFRSSSSHSASNPAKRNSRKPRYPSIRTHGLDSDDREKLDRRQSLIGDLIRGISQRVVKSREEDEEEIRPLNIPEEGDVQSESESEGEVSTRSSQTGNCSTRDGAEDEQKMLDLKAQRQEVDELINSLLQQINQPTGPVAQVTSNTGKTLGVFGPDNAFRIACKALVANRITEVAILFLIMFHAIVLIVQAAPAIYNPRENNGYFQGWEDAALLAVFTVYTVEAFARIVASGFLFEPQLVSITDSSGRKALLSHQQILLMRLKSIPQQIASPSDRHTDHKSLSANEYASICRQLHDQQKWRTANNRNVSGQSDTSQKPSRLFRELPFEKAIQRQRSMVLQDRPYLRHSWHRIDLISILSYWVAFFLALSGQEGTPTRHIYIFRALSVLRVSRLILISGGTSTILQSLKRAGPILAKLTFFLGFVGLLFSVVGMASFGGSLRRSCLLTDPYNSTNIIDLNNQCGGYIDGVTLEPIGYRQWDGTNMQYAKGYICPLGQICMMRDDIAEFSGNFDNIFTSALQSVIIASSNGWSDIMYQTIDSDFYASFLLSLLGVVLLNFWLVALAVAVVIGNFQAIRREKGRSGFIGSKKRQPRVQIGAPPIGWRSWITHLEYFWVSLIVASLALEHLPNARHNESIVVANRIITIMLDIDIIIRFISVGKPHSSFFSSGRNCFDLLVAITTTTLLAPAIQQSEVYPWLAVFSLVRWYRVVLVFPRMKPLIANVFGDFSGISNVMLFLLIMNMLAALIAVQLFRGDINDDSALIDWSGIGNGFIGAFIVMTSENWTDPLFATVNAEHGYHQGTIAALFIVAWFCIGNWVIMQLFVAVITESFESDESKKREAQLRIHLQRHKPFLLHEHWFERYNPYRWMTPRPKASLPQSTADTPYNSPERTFGAWLSLAPLRLLPWLNMTQSSKKSITGAPPKDDLDPSLQFFLKRNPAVSRNVAAEAMKIKRRIQASFIQDHPAYDRSIFMFWQHSPIRKFCQRLTAPAYGERLFGLQPIPSFKMCFDIIIGLTVVASVAVAATATPGYRTTYYEDDQTLTLFTWFNLFDTAVAAVFSFEAVIKIVADGLFFTPTGYLKAPRNLIDLFALFSIIANTATALSISGTDSRFIRSLMAAKVIRLITISSSLRGIAYEVLWLSFGGLVDASVLIVLWLLPFASWMTILFRNQLYSCNNQEATGISDCYGEFLATPVSYDLPPYLVPASWTNPDPTGSSWSFDNFKSSFLILFEIISLEGWTDVLGSVMDSHGEGKQPSNQASPQNAIPLFAFQIVGAAVLLSIFLAVLISAYARRNGTALLTRPQLEWRTLQAFLLQQTPSVRPSKSAAQQSFRFRCRDFALRKHGKYARLFTALYIVHTILLMMQDYDQSIMGNTVANAIFLSLTIIYLGDIAVRAYGLSLRTFIRSRWNLFDVFSVLGSLITTVIVLVTGQLNGSASQQAASSAQKVFLVLISLKLVQRNNSLNQLFKTSLASLPEVLKILVFWAILCLFYSILTTQIFGLAKVGNNSFSRHTNFWTWGDAMLMLSFMSTGEGWNGFMHDLALEPPRCTDESFSLQSNDCGSVGWAYGIFITWNILSMYFMLNLFTAVVVDSFAYVHQSSGKASLSRSQMRTFKKAWAQVDPDQTGYIPQNRFSELLTILPEPFYERPYTNDLSRRRLIHRCEVSSTIVGSPTIISGARHTIDVRKLESVLLDADRETLSERRRRMNELYQEAKLEEEPGKGICFQSTLLLLARYMLIDEREALTLDEWEVRRRRKEEVILLRRSSSNTAHP